jgi:hypothetical protein
MLDKSLIGVGKVEVSFENTCLFFKCEGYSCYLKKKKEKLRFLGENTLTLLSITTLASYPPKFKSNI